MRKKIFIFKEMNMKIFRIFRRFDRMGTNFPLFPYGFVFDLGQKLPVDSKEINTTYETALCIKYYTICFMIANR